jgi:uncharacterized membrane protein YdjX (TVP38/TMEM64 family)
MSRRRTHVIPLVAIGVLVGAGLLARHQLGIEASLDGVKGWVLDLGWYGPFAYVAVVVFRQLLALPAALVLLVGGLCFGGVLGTVLGTIGVVVSGLMKFGIARAVGREWLRARIGAGFERVDARIARLGPAVVGLGTAYPVGPLAPLHWGAGLSSISIVPFAVALVLGAPVRASAYSFLGASLLDLRSPTFVAASVVLVLAVALPLAFPRVRRRIFAVEDSPLPRRAPSAQRGNPSLRR